MEYSFKDLVDIPELQELTDGLYAATSIPSSIVAMDGEILTGSGRQRICADFHRKHPQIEKECVESDTLIREKLNEGEPFVIYKCPRGLVDASSPIVIGGEHLASVFSGQVFLAPPDEDTEEFFRQQAREFGFDEAEYIKAFKEVPILQKEKYRAGVHFLAGLARVIATMGLARLNELKAAEALQQSEQRFRILADFTVDSEYWIDHHDDLIYQSPSIERITGYTPTEFTENHPGLFLSIVHPADREEFERRIGSDRYKTERTINTYRIIDRSGKIHWLENIIQPLFDSDGNSLGLRGSSRDITERRRAEIGLQESEDRYRSLFDNMQSGVALHEIVTDDANNPVDYVFLDVNATFEQHTTLKKEDIVGRKVTDVLPGIESGLADWLEWIARYGEVAMTGKHVSFEQYSEALQKWYSVVSYRPGERQFAVISTDITERKRAEEELRKSEEQLRQAQRLESVGRLAGGVAHDFNNLLTTIIGYSELITMEQALSDTTREGIQEILSAAQRAAALTHQLLAFSRKQVLQSQVINLNRLIAALGKMLKRLIGEDIEITTKLDSNLGPIKADPGQVEQVIMNLVVNARDAMPDGGTIAIETQGVYLDESYGRQHPEVTQGDYVLLAVSDTGHGMDDETQRHIFEPFFTTKEIERGTGLGLSTIYGIVKQSGGFIWVYSEPGQGTTFKIYLPQVAVEEEQREDSPDTQESLRGVETILLVEDEEPLRKMTGRILSGLGYTIVEARSGAEALEVAADGRLNIDLLLTDVIMPKMSGKELSEKLAEGKPELKVLFVSGYTDNAIVHHGVLDEGVSFLQKPFSPKSLAAKVREILDEE